MSVKASTTAGPWTAAATALAPIAWGTSYLTITGLLPPARPLLVATMRVLPAGALLVIVGAVVSRWRPRGIQWWHCAVLAVFNFGLFFPLLTVAVYRLPGGVAAAVGGLQPLLVLALSWLVYRHRPATTDLAIGLVAALGVGLVVIRPGAEVDTVGVLAAVGANASFAIGVVLTRHLPDPPNRLAATGWQLLASGVVLLPLTAVAEGAPPAPTAGNAVGFGYLSVVATAVAFLLWFNGIRRLPVAAPPPRPCRPDDGRRARLGRPGSGADDGSTRRLRHDPLRHRVRGLGRPTGGLTGQGRVWLRVRAGRHGAGERGGRRTAARRLAG
jgi:probable blue pigment (indigoidine) exporter